MFKFDSKLCLNFILNINILSCSESIYNFQNTFSSTIFSTFFMQFALGFSIASIPTFSKINVDDVVLQQPDFVHNSVPELNNHSTILSTPTRTSESPDFFLELSNGRSSPTSDHLSIDIPINNNHSHEFLTNGDNSTKIILENCNYR